ncbi:hypothetical protein [Oceanobacter mangrovi]|uniref:hypothetical protein n=1 Tax=Oceanobacter mangrovi TaxID=2862510 RepID=UPI001C8DA2D8|nr:hypothetical protein [Oceanobacter mangrovi]
MNKELKLTSVVGIVFLFVLLIDVVKFEGVKNKEVLLAEGVVNKFYTSSTYDDITLDTGRYFFYRSRYGCVKGRESIDTGNYVKLEFVDTGEQFVTFHKRWPVYCLLSIE